MGQLLDGEDDKLGAVIRDPSVDSVIVLIQFRNLVRVSHPLLRRPRKPHLSCRLCSLSGCTCGQLLATVSCGAGEEELLQELLSRATCKLFSCESVALYVVRYAATHWRR
jgi:hypothetical protein